MVFLDVTDRPNRREPSRTAEREREPTDQHGRVPRPGEEDQEEKYLPVATLRNQYIDYLTNKVEEIEEQKNARRYYHCAHYTAEQLRILRSRHQPPLTWNRIARKINSIVGLVERMRSDPKALPRSPKSEAGAEISTQSIRYVLDANEFKSIDPWCILQCAIDGVAGVQMILRKGDTGDLDVGLEWVIGDEYFYDSTAYRMDFQDNRFEGIGKWMDVEAAIELYPDKADLLNGLVQGDSDLTTFSDREVKWRVTATRKIRLIHHWYKHNGRWCWADYVSNVLIDEGESPFFDERGNSISSFRMFACAVDHDGDRYSFVRNLKGPQDSLNQGKSKMLHLANSKLIRSEKGAVDDVETARREAARPDGYIETNPGRMWDIVDTKQDLAVFGQFTEDAKAELDGFANSNIAAMTGTGGIGNLSGRAIELLRQPGMAELGPFILAYRAWKLGIYRMVWCACQRYWTAERWLRVNNNDGLNKFIQLNGLGLDQFGRPVIVNAVGSLDVDVVLEEGPDVASMMADTYDALKGYPPGTFPPAVLIEMSSLPRSEKNRILEMMSPKPPPPDPMAELAKRIALEGAAGQVAKVAADTRKQHASAEQALATAEEKRAKVGTSAAAAAIDAAEFARDTLAQAHAITTGGAPQPPDQQAQGRAAPPITGARLAPDGNHYVADPMRPGKYLRVA